MNVVPTKVLDTDFDVSLIYLLKDIHRNRERRTISGVPFDYLKLISVCCRTVMDLDIPILNHYIGWPRSIFSPQPMEEYFILWAFKPVFLSSLVFQIIHLLVHR